MSEKLTLPISTLSTIDAGALIVGMVVGVGIFETPALVGANAQSAEFTMFAWFLGGVMSLIGALCYAELATAYPDAGGTYYYLMRAFGKNLAFLFAWARMAIIQTGSIALLAFVFGDYASQMLPLGEFSSALYACGAITLLTVINLLGLKQGKRVQNLLTVAKVLGLLLVIVGFSRDTCKTRHVVKLCNADQAEPLIYGCFNPKLYFILPVETFPKMIVYGQA